MLSSIDRHFSLLLFLFLSRMNIPLLVQGVSVILVQTLYPLFYFNTLRAFVDGQLEQGNVRVQ